MKATQILLTASALALVASAGAQTLRTTQTNVTISPTSGNLELGLTGGYAGGGNVGAFVGYKNLAGALGARIGLSRSMGSNGFNDSADLSAGLLGTIGQQKANGNITGEGSSIQTLSADATYDLGQALPGVAVGLYAGLRYGSFNSRLSFKGGQYTDYSSSALGVGLGSQAGYLLTNNISVIGDLGVDQYFGNGTIKTRDSQGNADSFSRGQGGYDAVNAAVRRPSTVLKASLGLKYTF